MADGAGRELYLYWRTRDRAGALAAVQSWQARLAAGHRGLEARVLVREDGSASSTLMEIYRQPGGIGAELQRPIVEDGDAALAPWIDGSRHVEVFVPAEPPRGELRPS